METIDYSVIIGRFRFETVTEAIIAIMGALAALLATITGGLYLLHAINAQDSDAPPVDDGIVDAEFSEVKAEAIDWVDPDDPNDLRNYEMTDEERWEHYPGHRE